MFRWYWVSIIAAVADGIYCIHSQAYKSIDNAFIEGDVIQVSLRVAGQVLQVLCRITSTSTTAT